MPRLGLRELTKAHTILESTSHHHYNHRLLLTTPTKWSTSHPNTSFVHRDARYSHRSFSSTSLHHKNKLNPPSTQNMSLLKPSIPSAAVVSNEHPAIETPAPLGAISIVFTDIVKSTKIWETDTQAMITAMKLHDDTIRSLTLSNQGYEVKQNGDGFMIAFPTATSAVRFALNVQEKLLDEEWPKELLKLAPGQETTDDRGHVLFRGLQLRISAHWGEPVSRWNEVIERMDYLGPVVNRAARFVQVTEPGQIVVSGDFLVQLQNEMQQSDDSVEIDSDSEVDLQTLRSSGAQKQVTSQKWRVRELGDYEFQGLDEAQKLYYVVPRSLEGRAKHWQQVKHVSGVKGNVVAE